MSVPQVVIVGRPNVGKSSLFNWLAQKRIAITDGTAGVTRDRVSYLMCHEGRYFELIDTGGMGFEDPDNLTSRIEEQIETAVDSASLILFVVDTIDGLTTFDQDVSRRLSYVRVPVLCVANKSDGSSQDNNANEFYRLGRGTIVPVSTKANRNRDELLREILHRLPPPEEQQEQSFVEPVMKVAIVGRRNTGKSTFVNTLARAERMIVSEVPGTTRDSVDVRFELDGKRFTAIDTPGLTRTRAINSDVAFYSTHRAERSIRRADVVLFFFDASQRISKVEKKLCTYISQQYKPCIFVVNKWDLMAGEMPTERWASYIRDTFRTMWFAPIAFITGQQGKNVKALLNHAQMLFKQSLERASTPDLNKLVQAAVEHTPPPIRQGRRPKIYYATQVSTQPPTIVMFCSHPTSFGHDYQRYLLGVFRDHLPFSEVPIKLYLRKRTSADLVDGRRPSVAGTSDEAGADVVSADASSDASHRDGA
ncbi:MAG: ribosome biogenesis GTPase Der [Planctomycetales bacterium]|nr:ribosome biogenesis GTPase Der [Planctomycetales bacterium]